MEAPSQQTVSPEKLSLLELMSQKYSLQGDTKALLTIYTKELGELKAKMAQVDQLISYHKNNLDIGKIQLANEVIVVGDLKCMGAEGQSCIDDAIEWLTRGFIPYENGDVNHYKDLYRYFFGAKNYDGWIGQRSDHTYGYGPRHGSIVFKVGLTLAARNSKLNAEQKEAAIYYLLNIKTIREFAKGI